MSNILFGLGRQNIGNKAINFSSDTLKASLLSMSTTAGKIYTLSAASNATPIVVTMSATAGITAGDILVVGGVGGNTAANGTWVAGTVTGTTVQLLTRLDSGNSTGNAAYTSGGWMIDISSASTLSDVSGNSIGTDVSLSGVTNTLGVINASGFTWTSLTATKAWAIAIYDSTAANDLVAFLDGTYQLYVITQQAAASTSIAVARLSVVIPSGTVIVFSDGTTATTTAQNAIGDTSLAVSSTAAIIHRQATADCATLQCGLPVTPAAGGNMSFTVDTNANKLFAI